MKYLRLSVPLTHFEFYPGHPGGIKIISVNADQIYNNYRGLIIVVT